MLRPRSFPRGAVPVTAALVLVTGVGPLATDTYVAALPELRRSLHTSATVAQLTLTAFIIGIAGGQLLLGPLSDALGRRRLLLGGALAFTVLSLGCALAPTGPSLVGVRLLQGLAAGCGVAIGRATVGDVYSGDEATKRYGTLAAINFLGPVVAPAVGGVILIVGSWRTVFAVLTGFGLLMLAAVAVGIPETLPVQERHGGGLRDTGARMGDLITDWRFIRHVAIQCLATAGFFVYIGGSSFVLETVYGISATRYAAVFATNATAMAVASISLRLLIGRFSASRLRAVGVLTATLASIGLVGVGLPGTALAAAPGPALGAALRRHRGDGPDHPGQYRAGPGGRTPGPGNRLGAAGRPVVLRRCAGHAADRDRRLPVDAADGPADGRLLPLLDGGPAESRP